MRCMLMGFAFAWSPSLAQLISTRLPDPFLSKRRADCHRKYVLDNFLGITEGVRDRVLDSVRSNARVIKGC
jgi:hypothetical protein